MIELQTSSYVKQCYELAVENHAHAIANYHTHDSQSRDLLIYYLFIMMIAYKQCERPSTRFADAF